MGSHFEFKGLCTKPRYSGEIVMKKFNYSRLLNHQIFSRESWAESSWRDSSLTCARRSSASSSLRCTSFGLECSSSGVLVISSTWTQSTFSSWWLPFAQLWAQWQQSTRELLHLTRSASIAFTLLHSRISCAGGLLLTGQDFECFAHQPYQIRGGIIILWHYLPLSCSNAHVKCSRMPIRSHGC